RYEGYGPVSGMQEPFGLLRGPAKLRTEHPNEPIVQELPSSKGRSGSDLASPAKPNHQRAPPRARSPPGPTDSRGSRLVCCFGHEAVSSDYYPLPDKAGLGIVFPTEGDGATENFGEDLTGALRLFLGRERNFLLDEQFAL